MKNKRADSFRKAAAVLHKCDAGTGTCVALLRVDSTYDDRKLFESVYRPDSPNKDQAYWMDPYQVIDPEAGHEHRQIALLLVAEMLETGDLK